MNSIDFDKYLGIMENELRSTIEHLYGDNQPLFMSHLTEIKFPVKDVKTETVSIAVNSFISICRRQVREYLIAVFNFLYDKNPSGNIFRKAVSALMQDSNIIEGVPPLTTPQLLRGEQVITHDSETKYLYRHEATEYKVLLRKLIIKGYNGPVKHDELYPIISRMEKIQQAIYSPRLPLIWKPEEPLKSDLRVLSGGELTTQLKSVKLNNDCLIIEDMEDFKRYWENDSLDNLNVVDDRFHFVITNLKINYDQENNHGVLYINDNGNPGRHALFSIHNSVSDPSRPIRGTAEPLSTDVIDMYKLTRFSIFLLRNILRSFVGIREFSKLHDRGNGRNDCLLYNPGDTAKSTYHWITEDLRFNLCKECTDAIETAINICSEEAPVLKRILPSVERAAATLFKMQSIIKNLAGLEW